MIESMTGFGLGTAQYEGFFATVEMKSVNHRHCQVALQIPEELSVYEYEVESRIKEAFERGRIRVKVEIENTDESADLQLDTAAARGYRRLLAELRDVSGVDEPITLSHLLTLGDLFKPALSSEKAVNRSWKSVQQGLAAAIEQLRESRRQEGRELGRDLAERIEMIGDQLDQVEERAPVRVEEARKRLSDRLEELIDDRRIDEDRLEQEVALLADKMDVTEECVRLRSHLKFFHEALEQKEPAGRRLKFLTQEMHREINTIGAKSNDSVISKQSVQMKEEVEKIREQIRNIE
jgi:uncharacterized protein (TIGR00255 family)